MIIGNETIIANIRERISAGTMPASSLFIGVGGIGKFYLALQLAEEMGAMTALDRIVMDSEKFSIEDVRQLQEQLTMEVAGDVRVVVIRNIEKMRFEAQNAFLKTLEEPPADTYFILTCDMAEGVLETIRSRCALFGFASVREDILKTALFDLGYSGAEVEEVWKLPVRKVAGDVINALKDEELREDLAGFVVQYENVLHGKDLDESFKIAESVSSSKNDKTIAFLHGLVQYARELALKGEVTEKVLAKCCVMLRDAESTNANRRLLLEEGFLNMHF